jgi:hypothetical protein
MIYVILYLNDYDNYMDINSNNNNITINTHLYLLNFTNKHYFYY